MKKKTLSTILFILTLTLLLVLVLTGCEQNREVTAIRVPNTEIFLSPYGDPSVHKLEISILPVSARNQDVYFRYQDPKDKAYLTVDADGTLRAKKEKTSTSEDEFGEEVKVIEKIYITIHSRDNPKVSLKISIIIEEVPVERMYFAKGENKIFLEESESMIRPQNVNLVFVPSHAVIGRDVRYVIDKQNILSIDDKTGLITPLAIGSVSVKALAQVGSSLEKPIEAKPAIFSVVYPYLQYKLNLDSPKSTLKQVAGIEEIVEFSLVQTSEKCDPTPNISWYLNDTAINTAAAKDSQMLKFSFKDLPAGEYRINALLSNSDQEITLKSDVFRIYRPLSKLRLGLLNEAISVVDNKATADKGDLLRLVVNKSSQEYPPEAYQWNIIKPDGEVEIFEAAPRQRDSVGGITIADYNYLMTQEGKYRIKVKPIVKGRPIDTDVNLLEITSSGETSGNDIRRVLVEGKKTSGANARYLPYITWKGLPYKHNEIMFEVQKEIEGDITIQSLVLSTQPSLYDGKGIFIPESMAKLTETFSVRMKGDRYGWTNWHKYEPRASFTAADYKYFDLIYSNQNGYISNIEDLAILLGELVLFRPTPDVLPAGMARFAPEGEGAFAGMLVYSLDIYTKYEFNENRNLYPQNAMPPYEDPNKQKISDMLVAAMHTYVEAVNMKFVVKTAQNDRYTIDLAFDEFQENFVSKPAPNTPKLPSDIYAPAGSSIGSVLPIDMLEERSVKTTSQLHWAAINGYKPVPVIGSPADKAYKIARKIIENNVKSNMNDRETVLALYDFIVSNTSYDYELAAHVSTEEDPMDKYDGFQIEGVLKASFTADGNVDVIFKGKGVCDGISKTMSLLMSMCGIANTRQTGLHLSTDVAHVWNLALINGLYYVVDATWALREINIEGSKYEYTSHQHILSTFAYSYGSKIEAYGKYTELGASPLYTAFNYEIANVNGQKYDKHIDTEAEFSYLFKTYLAGKINETNKDLWVDISFNLEAVAGNFVYDIFLADTTVGENETFNQYISDGKHRTGINNKIAEIIGTIEHMTVQNVSSASDTQDIFMLRVQYQ